MNSGIKKTFVQIIVPQTAIVQSVFTDSPCSLTLRTPSGEVEVRVSVHPQDAPDHSRLEKLEGKLPYVKYIN